MNKELQELLDEVYSKYEDSHRNFDLNGRYHSTPMEHTKESFLDKCKMDPNFSQKWRLKIEERGLGLEERLELLKKLEIFQERVIDNAKPEMLHSLADSHGIPAKLITIKYNDATIESYE
jgi:hypothetical protein